MQYIDTQEQWNELETILPTVLTTMIIQYVPLIELKWKPNLDKDKYDYKEECDTNIEWHGPLTLGRWRNGLIDIFFKDGIFEQRDAEAKRNSMSSRQVLLPIYIRILSGQQVEGYRMKRTNHKYAQQ